MSEKSPDSMELRPAPWHYACRKEGDKQRLSFECVIGFHQTPLIQEGKVEESESRVSLQM